MFFFFSRRKKKEVQTDCYSNEARARSAERAIGGFFPVRVMCHDAYNILYMRQKMCVYTRAGTLSRSSSGHGVNLALSMLIRSSASHTAALSLSPTHPKKKGRRNGCMPFSYQHSSSSSSSFFF